MKRSRWRVSTWAALLTTAFALPAGAAHAAPLSSKDAAQGARAAIKEASYNAKAISARCAQKTPIKRVCRVSWRGGLRNYKGTVTVTRGGIETSPVDTWSLVATGKAKYLSTERLRERGRVVVETRRAAIGVPLRLLGYDDAQVDVAVQAPVDPFVSENEFSTPPAGSRFVAFPVTITNSGEKRWTTGLYGGKLILPSGATLTIEGAVGCDPAAEAGPGETRTACVAFAVPVGRQWSQFEFGAGSETGVWAP